MKNRDRKAFFKQQLLEKKISYMNHDDREKMNELLNQIDSAETQEEKNILMVTLNSFIDERYNQYLKDEIVCNHCAICETCMRRKGVKSCGRFVEIETESEENND